MVNKCIADVDENVMSVSQLITIVYNVSNVMNFINYRPRNIFWKGRDTLHLQDFLNSVLYHTNQKGKFFNLNPLHSVI